LYDEAHKQHLTQALARVYAPVGEHKNLLSYLVRRLLENGANSSFVNRFLDDAIAVTEVVRDPVADVSHRKNVRHPHIPLPRDLYGSERLNAAGIDLRNGWDADEMTERMSRFHEQHFAAAPIVAGRTEIHNRADAKPVRNPARRDDVVGTVVEANGADVECALARASESSPVWDETPATERASILEAIANLYDCNRAELIALLVREAGKTVSDALAEVREAIDFCRYYATQCVHTFAVTVLPGPTGETNELTLHGRGVFACISPWNFPLAIFTGQISAALAAGNAVIAKPAPQTPLISHTVIRLMHRAGVPADILHLLPGGESVGKHLVNDPRVTGVAFTGSTDVARTINQNLADRPGAITTLIAETGGQNAMVVDSSALLEQVVDDVIASAFGAAGQRCSALRVVYVQDDIADEFVTMLTGAMNCLQVGDPWLLATDIGPVIDADAVTALEAHSLALADSRLHQIVLGEDCREGTFIAPTIFELESIKRLDREHFGPMLHVVRFHSERWRNVLVDIHAAGYGLTFGVHSRIDRHTAQALRINRAGNAYVNRNMIGAVVGVQPFGGAGLSGTGPKAGGPHYLARFATERVVTTNTAATGGNTELLRLDP
ncbi:MAG: bifunctional proline dehydrogenase/L-glutamate gamma-semialdehyde dehydrogenase PutA, partial [Gammaproteobacteria bacterium]|nr:bifunctional proline dehydrogenase/L-glutamate gamma-semialdehyde dehydrogenase PutA [Gammaproteobacteria bacterium]